jgi:hypothetical protein
MFEQVSVGVTTDVYLGAQFRSRSGERASRLRFLSVFLSLLKQFRYTVYDWHISEHWGISMNIILKRTLTKKDGGCEPNSNYRAYASESGFCHYCNSISDSIKESEILWLAEWQLASKGDLSPNDIPYLNEISTFLTAVYWYNYYNSGKYRLSCFLWSKIINHSVFYIVDRTMGNVRNFDGYINIP